MCWTSVCAIVSGFAEGVLRVTAVEARASSEEDPVGVRWDFRVSRTVLSSSFC